MKRLVTVLIIVVLLAVAFLSYLFLFGENDVKRNNDNKKTVVYDSFIKIYKNYLKDTFLSTGRSDIGEVQARFMSFNKDKSPMLLIKYNKNINVLKINNSKVDSKKVTKGYITYLYNIESNNGDFYIITSDKEENNYHLIKQLFNEENIVKENIKDKNSIDYIKFNSLYVRYDVELEFYDLSMENLENDLDNLFDHYKNDDYIITDEIMDEIHKEATVKEKVQLHSDENGIYNDYYRIKYGKYVYKNEVVTINKDLSCSYDKTEDDKLSHSGDKCLLYGKNIIIGNMIFSVDEDNEINNKNITLTLKRD